MALKSPKVRLLLLASLGVLRQRCFYHHPYLLPKGVGYRVVEGDKTHLTSICLFMYESLIFIFHYFFKHAHRGDFCRFTGDFHEWDHLPAVLLMRHLSWVISYDCFKLQETKSHM